MGLCRKWRRDAGSRSAWPLFFVAVLAVLPLGTASGAPGARRSATTSMFARCWRTPATLATARIGGSGKPACGWTFARWPSGGPLFPATRPKVRWSGGSARATRTSRCRRRSRSGRACPPRLSRFAPLDRRGGDVRAALGVCMSCAAAAARGQSQRLAAQCDRPFHRRRARGPGPASVAGRRSADARAAIAFRPDGAAADARGSGRLRRRSLAGGVRAVGGSAARRAAVRRADGHVLARRRPLRRQLRLSQRQ